MVLKIECPNNLKTTKILKTYLKNMMDRLITKMIKTDKMIDKVCRRSKGKKEMSNNNQKVFIRLSNKIGMTLFKNNKLSMISQMNKELLHHL